MKILGLQYHKHCNNKQWTLQICFVSVFATRLCSGAMIPWNQWGLAAIYAVCSKVPLRDMSLMYRYRLPFLRILGFGCNIALLETDQCCFLWSSYNIDKLAFNSDFLFTPYCKMDATVWTKAIWLTHCNGLWHSQWHFHWPFKLMPGF